MHTFLYKFKIKYVHASLFFSLFHSRYVLVVGRHVKGGMAVAVALIDGKKSFQSFVYSYY